MRFILLLFLIFTQSILLHNPIHIQAACSSCLISSVVGGPGLNIRGKSGHHRHRHHHHHHHYHHHHHAVVVPHDTILKRRLLHRNHHHHHHHLNLSSTTKSVFMYIAIKQLSTHFGYNVMKNTNSSSREDDNNVHSKNTQEKEDDNEQSSKSSSTQSNNNNNNNVSAGMVGAIGIYKNFISPLLPPACRFLPTCSQYGVQAIEEFGPTKGSILTAWRLLRCSPFGGRGYDPPIWPPVSYTYGSY